MEVLKFILVAVVGYLLGSLNTSLLVGKMYGVDVRQHGSGNAGATNTLRTLGKKAAILVGIGDVLKGVVACIVGNFVLGDTGLMLGGLMAVIGHNWPIYFGFKGGKGIFTSFAVVFMMDWKIGLMLTGVFLVVFLFTHYVSLSSIVVFILFPLFAFVLGRTLETVGFATVLGILAVYRHRANIQRLLNGTESKIGSKKK